jgi:uroporphyrinogen-III decarboxylase
MRSLGFPAAFDNIAMAPYDIIADYFRGATGMMKDLYRHPDKLLQVLDKMAVYVVRATLAAASQTDNPIVFIPIHWAPDAFMSQKQFEKFWWPSYQTVIDALIGAKLIPMTMWEHDCTRRLPFLREHTPKGKCIQWFERTDMLKACAALADVAALRGGLPGSLMISGTPAEVEAEVRRLVENVYDKGGRLILEGAFGLPDEAPVENVRAMCAAARRYGG